MNHFTKNKSIYFYLVTTLLFSILLRLIWVYQSQDYSDFLWNDQLMINTNDGYFFAEGARDILAGFHQANDLSPITHPLSKLTAFLASILPVSFETLILYMPVFFGSLLVVPVLLIASSIKETSVGLIAALLAGIAWSYYNRTMVGYYDTDMLNVVLPTLIVSTMIFAATHQKNRYLVIIPFSMIAFQWWYHGSYSINLALVGMLFVYTLIFERTNNYFYKIVLFSLIALIAIPIYIKITIIVALAVWFHFKQINALKIILTLLLISIIAITLTGGIDPVLHQLKSYVVRDTTMSNDALNLNFYNVAQTVREAGQIPFETFANRISGHTITFLISFIGYTWLLFRHKVMLLSLPLVGLGFLAYGLSNAAITLSLTLVAIAFALYPTLMKIKSPKRIYYWTLSSIFIIMTIIAYYNNIFINGAGLRFTVYAVPFMALGIGFIIVQVTSQIKNSMIQNLIRIGTTLLILIPNIWHIVNYKVPTVFTSKEIKLLDGLKTTASKEDYVVTWWDYGYPIRYYADVKTLVDGGKHSGDVNFPASFAMTKPQNESAYLSRLAVEYTELAYENNRSGTYIQMMMQDHNYTDPNDFLESMKLGLIKAPEKTRDIYYYLPLRMLDIYPTMALFSNIDLSNGQTKPAPFLYQSRQFKEDNNQLLLGAQISFNKQTGMLHIQRQDIPVSLFTIAAYDQLGRLKVKEQPIHFNGKFYIIYMPSFHKVLVMDKTTYFSTYIQLFVLEKYNRELYEQISISPFAKIYRLKN